MDANVEHSLPLNLTQGNGESAALARFLREEDQEPGPRDAYAEIDGIESEYSYDVIEHDMRPALPARTHTR